MQVVDILRAEKIAAGELRLKLGESDVRGIRIRFAALRATRGVERPDSRWIATPGVGRAHILDAKTSPQAV